MSGMVAGTAALIVGTTSRPPQARATNPNANPTTSQANQPQFDAYCNTAEQHIKGLSNQTGYVKGNANGVINFGSFMAADGTQRGLHESFHNVKSKMMKKKIVVTF